MKYNYLVLIQGGIGPDVWDREQPISAVDFRDASNQAIAKAEELGGHVAELGYSFREETPDREKLLRGALLEFVRVERMFGHTGQHSDEKCADCRRIRIADKALGHGFLADLKTQSI